MKPKVEVGGVRVDPKEPWRTENLGRLLLHALNSFEEKLLEGLHQAGFGFTRQVHLNVIRHVDREGTRMSHLATRLGNTRGATTQAVELCVSAGLVKLSSGSEDKRVRMVTFTAKGRKFLDVVHVRYDEIENETAKVIGEAALKNLRKSLGRLQNQKG